MALRAGFDPDADLHARQQQDRGRARAAPFEAGVGHLILDSFDEIERLRAAARPAPQEVLIRVTPGDQARRPTPTSQTGQLDSKFGFGLEDGAGGAGGRARARPPSARAASACTPTSARRSSSSSPTTQAIEALAELRRRLVPGPQRRRRPRDRLHGARTSRPRSRTTSRSRCAASPRSSARRRGSWSSPAARWSATPASPPTRVGTVKEIPGVRTYVAVDGGMSDNLRPMLYGSRYEALIADRAGAAPTRLATIAGMHCESGDILIRDAMLAAPARRRRARHPGDRRLRLRDGEQLQRRAAAAGRSSAATARRASSCAARPTRT